MNVVLGHNSLIKKGNSHCALFVDLPKLITPVALTYSQVPVVSCVLFFQQY